MAKITFKDKYLFEGEINGRRTSTVALPNGEIYVVIDPENVYRVGKVQPVDPNKDTGLGCYEAIAYKLSNENKISKVYGALEKAVLSIRDE